MGQVSVQQRRKGRTTKMSTGEFQGEFKPDGSISFIDEPDSTVADVLALAQIESGGLGSESALIKFWYPVGWDWPAGLLILMFVHWFHKQLSSGDSPDPGEAVLFRSPKLLVVASSC